MVARGQNRTADTTIFSRRPSPFQRDSSPTIKPRNVLSPWWFCATLPFSVFHAIKPRVDPRWTPGAATRTRREDTTMTITTASSVER